MGGHQSKSDWLKAIASLANDAALRIEMGARGRALVEQKYSTAQVGEQLVNILKNLQF